MKRFIVSAVLFAASTPAFADDMAGMDMSGMDMSDTDHMNMGQGILGSCPVTRDASGTSWQPDAASHEGIHIMAGDWMLMGHLRLDGIYDWQSGPRGDDMAFLAGMAMGMARRDFGEADTLQFRAMLSPDPFMGKRGYPLLLANGETADGATHLVDRQHPHDLLMELSGTYGHRFDSENSGILYFGYPGEPALGPTAFMHRASGMDNPEAPISHHWLDSTHITFGVLTAGVVHDDWKLEVSRFTGREPDQYRFNFDEARFDSTSARLSWNPDEHWSLQASWGFLKSPEQLEPTENETRYTASATYVTPIEKLGTVAATFAWGLKRTGQGDKLNALLAETEWHPTELWTLFTRAEWEENAELLATGEVVRAGKFSVGAIRDIRVADHLKLGLGALYDFDFVGHSLDTAYDGDPSGTMVFLRLVAE
ncbi:MAG TPA: hypothetical protein VGM36_05625 [Rhizomicrobium sp.]|jgi:hypothetical protein